MSEQPTKQNPVRSLVNAVKKHERKILVTTAVLSTAACVAMRSSISKHNAFLKEHGLYEQFYAIESTLEV